MTKRERVALRRSIYRVAVQGAILHLGDMLGPESNDDRWQEERGNARRRWQGPEVAEECKAAYSALVSALLVARNNSPGIPDTLTKERKP